MTILTLGSRALIAGIVATSALAPLSAEAQSRHGGGYGHGGGHSHRGGHGHFGGGYWGPGVFVGGLAIGIGLGSYNHGYGYTGYPGYVVVEPPPVYYPAPVQPMPQPLAAPPAQGSADPVIYPRNGQSAAQSEADRLACNRWATSLPSAMADASVFNRATAACMDGRGYTVR